MIYLLLICREDWQVLLQCLCGRLEYQLRPEVSQLVLGATQLLVAGRMGLDVHKGVSL